MPWPSALWKNANVNHQTGKLGFFADVETPGRWASDDASQLSQVTTNHFKAGIFFVYAAQNVRCAARRRNAKHSTGGSKIVRVGLHAELL
jgi:hypothetical protein